MYKKKLRSKETFVILNGIPMIIPKRNAERLFRIEVWIESAEVLKEFGLEKETELKKEKSETDKTRAYIY